MQSGPEQLKDWIERRGFNQRLAAAFLGWDESIISNMLTGKRGIGLENAVYLERMTGIPVEAWVSSELDRYDEAVAAAPRKR